MAEERQTKQEKSKFPELTIAEIERHARMTKEAQRLGCSCIDARMALVRELFSNFVINYRLTDDYKRAREKSLDYYLMEYVEAIAWPQAQAVVNRDHGYGSIAMGWNPKCAPHIPYTRGDEQKRFMKDAVKSALMDGLHVPMTDDIKRAIAKNAEIYSPKEEVK